MNSKQLELELEMALEDAAETPMLANLHFLWQQFEAILSQFPVREQLRLGGIVIDQLAELHQIKAEFLLESWENLYNPQDPILPNDWLQGLIRQTQFVELSELTIPVQRRPPRKFQGKEPNQDTKVGQVPKANVLKMLDDVERANQKAAALSVAHEESIQNWITTINLWFEQHPQPIPFLQLHQELGWPLVQLWLSLLLGGFHLEAIDENFYSAQILVYNIPK